MARSQRSLIPPDKQVPVMIVSAIIFAIILWWRFGPKPVDPNSGVNLVPSAIATGDTGALDELKLLVDDLAALEKPSSNWPAWRTEVERDPFHWSQAAEIEATGATEDGSGDGGVMERVRAADLNLSGVILDGRGGMALINGKYVRIGDSVEGCLVRAIGETSVTVEDASGTRELYLPEVGQQ